MMQNTVVVFLVTCLSILFVSCDFNTGKEARWYSGEEVLLGKKVFTNNCASCHGVKAQGLAKDWQIRLSDGSYPAPPLDGSAHAWHHDLPLLVKVVQKGGTLFDGKMPGFSEQLSKEEQLAAIAWFQSLWSDEIYHMWAQGRELTH